MTLFYGELAAWWPLISPVDDYADEALEVLRLVRERRPHARTLLELGSGGGHLAHHLRGDFELHLTDLSEPMLERSRALHPGAPHTLGDMRALELGQTFDVVLAHDALSYMLTEADLRAVFDTAWRHLAPGGLAAFLPDDVEETFEPGAAEVSGGDGPDGRAARLLEWAEARGPSGTVPVHYAFLLREADGRVRSAYERHEVGLFSQATWERLLAERGFTVEVVRERTDDPRTPRLFFFGHKPG